MNANPNFFDPPKNLWLSKGFEFHFPLRSEACKARMVNNLGLEAYLSGDRQFAFSKKGFRRSNIVTVGEIIPTGEKSCKVVGRTGLERGSIILDLVAFAALMLIINGPTISSQHYDQFLEANLVIGLMIAF